MWVGKTWTLDWILIVHSSGQKIPVNSRWTVEAKEKIKVPAGTFEVFRVSYGDPGTDILSWWSPELGINVKRREQRNGFHYIGPGVRETELISHTIRR